MELENLIQQEVFSYCNINILNSKRNYWNNRWLYDQKTYWRR